MTGGKPRGLCPPDHPHGRRSTCYRTHRCGCLPCRQKEARRKAGERERQRTGRHQGMRDKAWVVGHIEALMLMGMTARDIARCSGVNEATIHRLVDGRGERVFPQTAKAIMAVRPESAAWRAPKAWVTSVGTVRRIQALMAIGHSGEAISEAAGRGPAWAAWMLRNGSPRVEESSRAALADAYERMSMTVPEGQYATRARRRAAALGYVPPLAWDDDIDDPAAVPNTSPDVEEQDDVMVINAALVGDKPDLTPEQRREVVTTLHYRRWSAARIADHIGCNPKTVERIRAELGLHIYTQQEMADAA